jgi:hypothetical protein
MTHHYDSSASGYISDSFEGISREFTDVEISSKYFLKPADMLVMKE